MTTKIASYDEWNPSKPCQEPPVLHKPISSRCCPSDTQDVFLMSWDLQSVEVNLQLVGLWPYLNVKPIYSYIFVSDVVGPRQRMIMTAGGEPDKTSY